MSESIISPPELARTYSPTGYEDGWEVVDQYLLVVEWAELNPEASWYEAARTLELPRSRVQRWYDGEKPSVVRKVEFADARGWFDATWDSDIGRAFNLVVAGVLSGGYLGKEYGVGITLDSSLDDETSKSLKEAMRILVGSSKIRLEDDPQRSTVLEPGTAASLLGRALNILGIPRGRKTETVVELPGYISKVSELLREEFVELYVLVRGSRSEGGGIDLREERPQRYLDSLAALIEDVTAGQATVRTNGIYLQKGTVQKLSGSIVWNEHGEEQ